MRNKWFINENIQHGKKLIDGLGNTTVSDTLIFEISEEDTITLEQILKKDFSNLSHKCISVYRDAIVLNNKTYNICLSCGDIIIDNKKYYLTMEQHDVLKNIKEKYK